MRNSINNRRSFVVFGVRQGNVVVAGRDHLRSLDDAHLLVSRLKAKSCEKRSLCKSSERTYCTATTATSAATTAAAVMATAMAATAGSMPAGISSRQWRWQPRRLPQPPCSRS
jgi:hypothetical protein